MNTIKVSGPLAEADPEAAKLIAEDLYRDASCLNLAAAESYATLAVREALAAPIIGLEGYPGKRYHSGSWVLDEVELLCQRRALEAFEVAGTDWRVNVQPLSGSLANLYTYVALANSGDTILRMELSHGGHLSHGHQSGSKKISETSHRFNSVPYHTDPNTGRINYEEIETLARKHKPRIITTGYSAYCRLIDFPRLRKIADEVQAYLHCDMAHIVGLVATKNIPSPFPYCDVITTTTFKTVRGPSSAMIFSKEGLSGLIDRTLFPRFQAGMGFNNLLAMAVTFGQVRCKEIIEEQGRFLQLAKVLEREFLIRNYKLVSGGTDIHMILIDLKDRNVTGGQVEKVLELANIICNRNSIPGDSAGISSGLRLATPQMTIRGVMPELGGEIAEFVHRGIEAARRVVMEVKEKARAEGNDSKEVDKLSYFVGMAKKDEGISKLKNEVREWVRRFPPPPFVEMKDELVGMNAERIEDGVN